MSWMKRAACRGLDPELFFPVSETGEGAAQAAVAKDVCATCPVRRECLDWALETHAAGVWGGTTESERRVLRREAISTGTASEESASGAVPVYH